MTWQKRKPLCFLCSLSKTDEEEHLIRTFDFQTPRSGLKNDAQSQRLFLTKFELFGNRMEHSLSV